MGIRVVQWNIRINSDARAIAERIRLAVQGATIVHLQEVSESSFAVLRGKLQPDGVAFSLLHRQPGKREGRNRRMGVATLTFGSEVVGSKLVDRSVFPERSLATECEIEGVRVRSLNFHSLTGVDYKKAKSSNFASLADFLESEAPDFMCCDANEPKVDSFLGRDIEFFDNRDKGRCAAMIFGETPCHPLSDSYKAFLRGTGKEAKASPLATSHVVSGRPRRYDHIFHSPIWRVKAMSYDYNSARQATSDHAIVLADFCHA